MGGGVWGGVEGGSWMTVGGFRGGMFVEVAIDECHGMFSQQVHCKVAVIMSTALQEVSAMAKDVWTKYVMFVRISALPS